MWSRRSAARMPAQARSLKERSPSLPTSVTRPATKRREATGDDWTTATVATGAGGDAVAVGGGAADEPHALKKTDKAAVIVDARRARYIQDSPNREGGARRPLNGPAQAHDMIPDCLDRHACARSDSEIESSAGRLPASQ